MKIVLTGAMGRLGTLLRPVLADLGTLVSTDIGDGPDTLLPGETYVQADLGDFDAIRKVVEGADQIVHFGAIADEAAFEDILHSNIRGAYNIWQAGTEAGVRRVVYASSIHAVGMTRFADGLDGETRHQPDSYYGLAKCFAEDLAKMYWRKHQIEAVCLRIGGCAQPTSARYLSLWLSYDDLERLVLASVTAPVADFTVLYGVSANSRSAFDNSHARHIGYAPQDDAEAIAPELLKEEIDPHNLAQTCIGGGFAPGKLGQSAVAAMGIKS